MQSQANVGTTRQRWEVGGDCQPAVPVAQLRSIWLELTGLCQLKCVHCYAESGPHGTHGTMTFDDWIRIIDEAKVLGVGMVQLIGGEPTLYPRWDSIVGYALGLGIEVEVYSNLVRVPDSMWDIFALPGVSLATSYYSADEAKHNAITGRASHAKTLANIQEALRRDIPIRVGVVGMHDDQRVEAAVRQLGELGVRRIRLDHLRQVGRGVRDQSPSTAQLCGQCGRGKCAVGPDGNVWPCVFARWEQTTMGNVRETSLNDILTGTIAATVNRELKKVFGARIFGCTPPSDCDPKCNPKDNGPYPFGQDGTIG